MFNEDNNSRCSYFVEEERELRVPRVPMLLEHAPPQLGPLVHHHLAHVTVRSVVIQKPFNRYYLYIYIYLISTFILPGVKWIWEPCSPQALPRTV